MTTDPARMQADWTGIDPDGPEAGALLKLRDDHRVVFER